MGAGAFVATLGLTLLTRQQALKHSSERPEGLSVRQAVTAGLTMLAVVVLALGTTWMTHRVTVLVTGDDLLQVVSEVDEQWWPGPGPDAFRRAGLVFREAGSQ